MARLPQPAIEPHWRRPPGRVTADQVFSNCPKYIAQRAVDGDAATAAPAPAEHRSTLSAEDRHLIAAADTVAIATAAPGVAAEASHRRGSPRLPRQSGAAAIDWSAQRAAAVPGAQRIADFTIDRVIRAAGVLPMRWVLEERSRFSPPVAA